jgi:AcrR family transcriptional regulator
MPRHRRSRAPTSGLRDVLVQAAAALIAKKGPQGFSLREVARRARVSEAAPYWHFADREALLAAVAERGFVEMAKEMLEIRANVASPRQRLRALGLGYVRFALAHPSYLRVMFGSEVPDKAAHPTLKAAGDRTFELLVQTITEGQAAGQVRGGDPVELAVAAWSIVHGLAALLVDGKLKDHVRSPAEAERLAGRVTELFILGLAPR